MSGWPGRRTTGRPMNPAEILSLTLTVPTLAVCVIVVWTFAPKAWEAIRRPGPFAPADWLLVGIVLSFAAAFADNLFWGAFWLAHAWNDPLAERLFKFGPHSNVMFRQSGKLAAGACHITAAVLADRGLARPARQWLVALLLLTGLAFAVLTLALR